MSVNNPIEGVPVIDSAEAVIETAAAYAAYSVVVLAWNAAGTKIIGTQTASGAPKGTVGVTQSTTTSDNPKTRVVIRGLTRIKTDLSAVSNLDEGEALEASSSGDVALAATASNRRIGHVYDETNDYIIINGNGN